MSAVLTIGAAMAGIFPSALESQTPKSILSQEEYCRRLQATLVDRNSGTEYLNAISNIQSCQSVAAKSLVAQWNRKQTDPAVLDLLGRISPLIRDQQLFEVTVRIARDATRPRNERLAAFAALAGYADPTVSISFHRLDETGLTGFSYVWLGRTSVKPLQGMTPLHLDTRNRVLEIFTETAKNEKDETIRAIASFLENEFVRTTN
jgi:hypothetical protein